MSTRRMPSAGMHADTIVICPGSTHEVIVKIRLWISDAA